MRALVLALLALLAPVYAAAQDNLPTASIVVTPDGENLLVTITLDRPVERLPLEQAAVVRDEALELLTHGLSYSDQAISGDSFSIVSLRLKEDLTERDARYPAYYRIGEGRLLFAPAILPELAYWDVSLVFADLPDGWNHWPEVPNQHGFVFIGPENMIIEDGGARFVFNENVEDEMQRAIRENVVYSLQYLVEIFSTPPAAPPFVASSRVAGDENRFVGDVTDHAMVALRFNGVAYDPNNPGDPGALATLRSIILHEGVHFWNGGVATSAEGTPAWLHEGGAEYLATLGSLELGWTSRDDLHSTIARWISGCRTSLSYSDEVAMNELSFIPSSLRYTCGPLLQFLAELYLAENRSELTVALGWRKTVATAVAGDGEYDLADFVAALGDPALLDRPALAAILATSGPERWDIVDAEMARLGVEIAEVTSPPLRARTALMFLIGSQCTQLADGEGYGFYSSATSYRLDTPEGCGVLTGDPVIATLGGHPIATLTETNYAELQEICGQGGSIVFGPVAGDAIEVPCTAPLPDPVTQPSISTLPDIPAFAR